ncbi:MAG TPA: PQQ-binding-like beta-propeller repeat protein, partial [Gaiellaceae bacterium]|nr:PQQ-binding-like beta-propeller repeat protein [Gaiellaceae bacterium]
MHRPFVVALLLAAIAVTLTVTPSGTSPASGAAPSVSGNWLSWGRTLDQTRHSPLRQITRANIGRLGRVFNVDFRAIDGTMLRGQQAYPLIVNGRIYVTTADNNVFALDGTTGRVIWRYKPANTALFANFGIRANRGVAYCGGRLFLATLDMHLVALNAATGRLLARVPVDSAVPGASSNYGYGQTSAPICAKGRVLMGAAGSEYGIRGFVMAWRTNLTPAWANPYWTIPPPQSEWRKRGRLVGGGAVWTPVAVDTTTNIVYFGTGSATPLYQPSLRPGPAPRTDSLIAVDLMTGRQKWWRQQMARNEWAYDTAQPPVVYNARVGGKRRRIVSVATMEGVWFAYDARTGTPIYQRVKVLDRVEHPSLKPGQPVAVFPGPIGGLNYSPASYDPATNLIINAAAETAGVLIQDKLTPTQKRRKLVGDIFTGLTNGEFGTLLPGWRNHGSISAIDVNTGRRVWKFRTPEPERGGVTTTASGLGFAGGGDGVLRAFETRTGRVLWTFQTGFQIAAGPSIYSVGGKQYIAITVGGTPTSSNGGLATRLQVFALDGSKQQSPPPNNLPALRQTASVATPSVTLIGSPTEAAAPTRATTPAAAASGATIQVGARPFVRRWQATGSNEQIVVGRLLLRGMPVRGARVRVNRYQLPSLTDSAGRFRYRADVTMPKRHVVTVVSASRATVRGRRLSSAERSAVLAARGGINVAYRIRDVRAKRLANGNVLVTGRATLARGTAPPPAVLFTYMLSGKITDSAGRPVQNAVVVTRTLDRDFWTFSEPSDSEGNYSSFYTASDKENADPVPLQVQVAHGDTSYALPGGRNVSFKRLRSATLDIKIPTGGGQMSTSDVGSYVGGVYDALLIGVASRGRTVRPVSATWPDSRGRFRLVL